ncbi:hypothetical protein JCM3775_004125 [Rhodotorula graminis]
MAPLLAVDALALQLETLELAQSIFPLPGELVVEEHVDAALPSLRAWIEHGGKGDRSAVTTDELSFHVTLSLEPAAPPGPSPSPSSSSTAPPPYPLVLAVRIPLTPPVDASATLPDGTSAATVHLQQPPWLSRTAHDALAASLPSTSPRTFLSNTDLLLDTIDYVRNQVIAFLPDPAALAAAEQARATGGGGGGGAGSGGEAGKRRRAPARADGDEDEFRVWLWFPSLSTREKRDNIVDWAGEYEITGFVLAGKPAIMCLEGTERMVQEFLGDIKANSWADIPSFQKKVSERYRTPLLPPLPPGAPPAPDPTQHRIFSDMSEITSLIARTGGRANRGEMGDVRDFLAEKGLAEAFGAVVGGGQFS